jgi:integrase
VARTIRDASLDTRAARSRLKARGKPYYRKIEEGAHLGYRKPKGRRDSPAVAGKWVARLYVGGQSYVVETLAAADDFSDADGIAVLNFGQAQAMIREMMVSRAHTAAGKVGPLTVKEAGEDYLRFLETNRKSANDARYRVDALIYPELADLEVEKLTTERLERWHIGLAKAPPRLRTREGEKQQYRKIADDDDERRRRRSSANRVLTILKAALNRAWRRGKVTSDAAWRRLEPFENVDAARVRYLTIAEAARLVNATDSEFRPLVQAGLVSGGRYGELAALRASDFNRDSGTIHVRTSKSGKGRHIVLDEEGVALFKAWSAGKPGNALLFPKKDGSPWNKSNQARPMRDACDRAKIKPRISIHTLRHTWASLAVMNGVPLLVVAKNLGHADTRMVERHYGHLAPSYVADAIRKGAPKFGFKADSKVATIR